MFARSNIARVHGERFDCDHLGWLCDECDRDEYSCDCEAEDPYQHEVSAEYLAMTADEREAALKAAHDKIAAVFAPTGWAKAEVSALAKRDAA